MVARVVPTTMHQQSGGHSFDSDTIISDTDSAESLTGPDIISTYQTIAHWLGELEALL